MATTKPKKKAPVKRKTVTANPAQPKYSFGTLFFIDGRAKRIVQGKVEKINTIHSPIYNGEKKIEGVQMTHYYTMRTDVFEFSQSICEDHCYPTHDAACKALGKDTTDYLK